MVRGHLCLSPWALLAGSLLLLYGVLGLPSPARAAELSIVLDDIGYSKTRGLRAVALPRQVTLAVLPFAPQTQSLLPHAVSAGHDIIIHQPMQPHPSPHVRHEHDTLTLDMSPAEFAAMLARADHAVPVRLGISNHTGSLLTSHHLPMRQLMQHLRARNLFFLDSRTTAATVAVEAAQAEGVVALQRDVFLDNVRAPAAIHRQFNLAIGKARAQGSAILVGHPYPETLAYLERRLNDLPTDVRLVKLSTLASRRQATLAQQRHPASPHISLGQ